MVFNYGPRSSGDSGFIEFDPGVGGGKFDPLTDLLVKFSGDSNYQALNSAGLEKKYKFAQDATGKKWEVAFLASCEVQFNKNLKKCDIFLVGGGGSGGTSSKTTTSSWGGTGGAGGQLVTNLNITFLKQTYNFNIGQSDGDTTIDDIYRAQAKYRANGGQQCITNYNGGTGGATQSASGGGEGEKAFENTGSIIYLNYKFGAGGGGGGCVLFAQTNGGSGGADGGGNGGTWNGGNTKVAVSGSDNSGSGGGGAFGPDNDQTSVAGAAGGSGIIIIRGNL